MRAEPTPAAGQPLQALRLAVSGFELHAERWAGGERVRVLLVHGLGGNSVTWHGVAPALARTLDADVLAVDLPGFGRSRTGGRAVGYRAFVEILETVLRTEASRGQRWLVAGNSLGAVLALELAGRLPELVAGASVVAPALPLMWGRDVRGIAALRSWLLPAVPWLGRRLIASYMGRTGLPGIVDEPVKALFGDPRRLDPELRERLLGVSSQRLGWVGEAGRAYEQVTRSLGIELLLPARAARRIRELRCPVQAICGARDPVFSAAPWQTLRRLRPDWDYVTLDDVGHVPQLEAPAEVARCFSRWALGVVR